MTHKQDKSKGEPAEGGEPGHSGHGTAHHDMRDLKKLIGELGRTLHGHGVTLHEMNGRLHELRRDIMGLKDDLKDLAAQIDAETNAVAARIEKLVAQLATGTLSDADKAEVVAAFGAEIARLKTLGADPSAPVPPVPAPLAAMRAKK
jgi:chromosome segregation ATPase